MELNFEVTGGSGRPLIILHGLFGAGRNWRSFARGLVAGGRRIYLIDQRNHGNSAWHDSMSYHEMAGDLADFMETHRIGKADLLGHSMGGKVAMRLVLQEPQLCMRLIVLDIAPVPYPNRFDNLLEAMLALPVERCRTRTEADQQLAHNVPNTELRQFLLQNLQVSGSGYRWCLNLPVLREHMDEIHDFPEPAEGVCFSRPALFLRGMDSDYVLPEHRSEIIQLFPQAEILGVPDAGHWLHSEQPEAVLNRVLHFLNAAGERR